MKYSDAVCNDIWLPRRAADSAKGDYGGVLVVAGSVGYTGAPTLCARAAVRGGAGLVFLGVPGNIYEITAVKNEEAMPFPLSGDADGRLTVDALPAIRQKLARCGVLVMGPGLGRSDDVAELCRALAGEDKLIVADADALWALSGDMASAKGLILTPHEGEFRRMGGEITGDRVSDAARFAEKHGCCTVLKGHETVVAWPDGEIYVNHTGNPGMATGGSGDVLAGIIGAMLCQLTVRRAVRTAVWLHGRAGDIAARDHGEYGMIASDIIGALPMAMKEITEE